MSNIVLIGVGGSGISAIARLFLSLGYTNLIGIEKNETEQSKLLQTKGLQIIDFDTYSVQATDLVIYSAARKDCAEVKQSASYIGTNPKRVSPPMMYFEFLGEISKHFTTIAVAGTHGKSTTTGMLGVTLASQHPDAALCLVGAGVTERGGDNMRVNPAHTSEVKMILDSIINPKAPVSSHLLKKYLFTVEADEYNKHLLHLDPDYSIITTLELDHSDIYPNTETYLATFDIFVQRTRQQFYIPDTLNFLERYASMSKAHIVPTQQFHFQHLVGGHNHTNASLALALATDLIETYKQTKSTHLPPTEGVGNVLKQSIESNHGLWRRCETLGSNQQGATIISDYAHHPTELSSTFIALHEKYPDKQLVAIFQPHQVRRVLEFWEQFVEVLSSWDNCLIFDIYAARENLASLKTQFSNEATANISSVDELGEILADACQQKYSTDIHTVLDIVANANIDQVVVIFSAGGLDYKVRQFLAPAQSHQK